MNNDQMRRFRLLVKRYLEESGMSQKELNNAAGLTSGKITKLLNGWSTAWSPPEWAALGRAMGMDLSKELGL